VSPRTWVLLSDKQGDNGQVETIVAALPWAVERKYVHMLTQWVLGKPRYRPSLEHIDPAQSDPIEGPWPDLILTVGRLHPRKGQLVTLQALQLLPPESASTPGKAKPKRSLTGASSKPCSLAKASSPSI
jgi:glycosyltransferase involved in cell wall biosynthesis